MFVDMSVTLHRILLRFRGSGGEGTEGGVSECRIRASAGRVLCHNARIAVFGRCEPDASPPTYHYCRATTKRRGRV